MERRKVAYHVWLIRLRKTCRMKETAIEAKRVSAQMILMASTFDKIVNKLQMHIDDL